MKTFCKHFSDILLKVAMHHIQCLYLFGVSLASFKYLGMFLKLSFSVGFQYCRDDPPDLRGR